MSESIPSIGIVGNGITGKASALEISDRFGENASIIIYDNFKPSLTTRPVAPSHLGPIGLEVQSGNLWNGYEFGDSDGGLYCDVREDKSITWLEEFARRSREEDLLAERQLELYLHNLVGIEHYRSHPEYAQFVSKQGNIRLFKSEIALGRAAEYLGRIAGIYIEEPEIYTGVEEIRKGLPKVAEFDVEGYAGGIYYPEDATGDSLKIQAKMDDEINKRGIKIISSKIIEAESSNAGVRLTNRLGKSYLHDLVVLGSGIENEDIMGVPEDQRWLYPFAGRRIDLEPTRQLNLGNTTIGLDDECFILRQANDGRIQTGGTVIIRDRGHYKDKIVLGDDGRQDDFITGVLSERLKEKVTVENIQYGTRAMTQDDLPSVYSPNDNGAILMANPTGHLGFLQAPSIANRVADYAEEFFDTKTIDSGIDNKLMQEQLRRLYRRKGPKTQPALDADERPKPRRGSRSNFVALRRQIIESGRGNAKKPMTEEQKKARRKKK